MAPSPTGEYHIGSIRTMLYNYAFAKKNNGVFILRIEDTDRQRFVPGALERILQVIKDYGLSWDEGPEIAGPYAPYIQSERFNIYKDYALKLVESGHAYYCFCSAERLEKNREDQRKTGSPVTKYDKLCLKLSKDEVEVKIKNGEKYVVRFKMPDTEEISFDDLFLGNISFNTVDLDDYVLLKSDGFPTYHLAVVVDDYLMKISHVFRGIEWLPSTPKHVLLYKAFGWKMPLHGHLPNLKELGATKKLSKRSGTVDANLFLKDGYLSEAVLNFLMFLGWNPGTEREIYSLEEFINDFSLDRIHKTDLVAFDREKLLWYNGYYIRSFSCEELFNRLLSWSVKYEQDLGIDAYSHDYVIKVLGLIQERLKTLSEFSQLTGYFFGNLTQDKNIISKFTGSEQRAKIILTDFLNILSAVEWKEAKLATLSKESVDKACHEMLTQKGYKPKEAFMTLRLALTGVEATPHIFDVIEVLGKEETLKRVKFYLD